MIENSAPCPSHAPIQLLPRGRQGNRPRILICLLTSILLTPGTCLGESVGEILDEEQDYQRAAQQSQKRVEALDDETLSMLSAYHRELERYEDLVTYNDNMRELLASQADEKARLDQELEEIEVVRQAIVPLMVEMVDVLQQFIELDQPMLLDERNARLDVLKTNLTRSDVDIAEKYRRIIETYQIEAEYGQSIEAYEGSATIAERELTVDFLRVGRVALYYLSLDRQQAGIWDTAAGSWQPLDPRHLDAIDYAVRVARKQAPPNLVELPLWTRETP